MKRFGGRRKHNSSTTDSNNRNNNKRAKKEVNLGYNEDIDSDIEDNEEKLYNDDDSNQGDDNQAIDIEETADAKKIRMAREFLKRMDEKDDDDDDEGDDDDDDSESDDNNYETNDERLSRKLQRERLKVQGTLERAVADKVVNYIQQQDKKLDIKYLRGHDLTPTCVALVGDKYAVSGSKDHSVILWDLQQDNCKKVQYLIDPWKRGDGSVDRKMGEVLCVAGSDNGRYVSVGKRDGSVSIFDMNTKSKKLVKTFTGHKGPITCLTFRTQSLQLFSGSEDRCIRHYDLNELMYIETLYGHQFAVSDIDCHAIGRPVSVGRDRTARGWKLAEDTHLIFRGGSKTTSADCISCIKDNWFVTGHDNGQIDLWMTEKKRPVDTVQMAHGSIGNISRGITALDSLKGSDLVISGSNDGYLRFWKMQTGLTLDSRGIVALSDTTIPIHGFVNDIVIGPKAKFCIAALGQEPKLGRWDRVPKAKNRIAIIPLSSSSTTTNDNNNDDSNGSGDGESEEQEVDVAMVDDNQKEDECIKGKNEDDSDNMDEDDASQ